MTITRRLAVAALAGLLAAVALATVALAQEGLEVRIRGVDAEDDGTTSVVVSVVGDAAEGQILAADQFDVTEQGSPVEVVDAEPLLEGEGADVRVALVIDTSGSMSGQPMEDTKAAATSFLGEVMEPGVQVALIAFSSSIELLVDFTDDQTELAAAIDDLDAGGATPLYDAVVFAADQLAGTSGQANLVVFSDGGDTNSEATLDGAIEAAQDAESEVLVVALDTEDLDPDALDAMAEGSGGRVLTAVDSAALVDAFGEVAQEIASQYVVRYQGTPSEAAELDIAVTVTAAGATASDAVVILNPWTDVDLVDGEPRGPRAVEPSSPILGIFANPVGLWLGIAAAFVAVLGLLYLVLVSPVQTAGARSLSRGLKFLEGSDRQREPSIEEQSRVARAAELVDARMGEESRADLQVRLERAAWKLRPSEFRLIQIAAGIGGAIIGAGLLQSLILGAVFAVAGVLIPLLVLTRATDRRARRFEEQLPDVLQLLAGSLRAGYGFLQAIDTVAQEATDPAASEFARALNEARLGGSIDDALEAMANRLDSEDFHWVVIAVTIQRQVGGNLAEVLETVAETIRERERLRRHVRGLSAEGRLSAWILILLPFAVAGYIMVVNPRYMESLIGTTGGLIAILIMLILMGIGTGWIRKIIQIDI